MDLKKDLSSKNIILAIIGIILIIGIVLTVSVVISSNVGEDGFEEVTMDENSGGTSGQVSLQIIDPPEEVETTE